MKANKTSKICFYLFITMFILTIIFVALGLDTLFITSLVLSFMFIFLCFLFKLVAFINKKVKKNKKHKISIKNELNELNLLFIKYKKTNLLKDFILFARKRKEINEKLLDSEKENPFFNNKLNYLKIKYEKPLQYNEEKADYFYFLFDQRNREKEDLKIYYKKRDHENKSQVQIILEKIQEGVIRHEKEDLNSKINDLKLIVSFKEIEEEIVSDLDVNSKEIFYSIRRRRVPRS